MFEMKVIDLFVFNIFFHIVCGVELRYPGNTVRYAEETRWLSGLFGGERCYVCCWVGGAVVRRLAAPAIGNFVQKSSRIQDLRQA